MTAVTRLERRFEFSIHLLVGVLQGNGNFIERILSRFFLRSSPEHADLRELVSRSLSRRLHRHCRGFASGQLREWEKDGFRSAKKLLYVLRTTLTGTHALLTGAIETDVPLLLDEHGFSAARELVDAKRRGERSELPAEIAERWRKEVGRAFDVRDGALARSHLPEEPGNVREIEAWLTDVRRRNLDGSGLPARSAGTGEGGLTEEEAMALVEEAKRATRPA